MEQKYNPDDFSWDKEIQSSMKKIYNLVDISGSSSFALEKEVGNLHFLLKHAVVNGCISVVEAHEVEFYFWGLVE